MPPRVRNALLAFAVALVAYGAMLFTHLCDVAGGSDSSGYLNEARMIASGRFSERIDILDKFGFDDSLAPLFVPLGYDVTPVQSRVMVPTYPAGLPMHMALAGKRGAFFVTPIAALIAIALMAWLAYMLTESWAIAIGAAAALASSAVFIYHALQPVSDVLVTMWSIAAIATALHARKDDRWSFVAGAAFAISVWVRPANVLLGPALLVALPRYKRAFIGAAIVLAPLLIWNAKLYGGPLRTGYGPIAQYLELAHVPARAWHYIRWTIALLSPFAIVGMLQTRVRLLAAWWWPFFLFYCFYTSYDSWSYTRFLLPAYPALIIGSLVVARRISPRIAPAIVVCSMIACGIFFTNKFNVLRLKEAEGIYPDVVRWSAGEIPRDSLVIAMQLSGARKYYRHEWSLRWEWLDRDWVQKLERRVPPDRWYAVLYPFEVDEVMRRVPGQWTKIAEYQDITLWHRTR